MSAIYDLSWEKFSQHLCLMLKDIHEIEKYSDVTLISGNETQFKAHKIVLSACSPVFKKIIDTNPSQHPLIYLRGIQSYEIESILQFMYLGEGRFYQERMGEFIKVAKDLEVKEISKGVDMQNEEEDITEEAVIMEDVEEETEEVCEPETSSTDQTKQRKPRSQISSDTKSTECPECGAVFTQKSSMVKHYRSKHEGIKYPCNQCDYQATQQGQLQSHISAKHSDNILKCDHCDYQTKWRSSYYTHMKTTHSIV